MGSARVFLSAVLLFLAPTVVSGGSCPEGFGRTAFFARSSAFDDEILGVYRARARGTREARENAEKALRERLREEISIIRRHAQETGKYVQTSMRTMYEEEAFLRGVKYYEGPELSSFRVYVRDGKIVDAAGKPVDTRDASQDFRKRHCAIFTMDPNGQLYLTKVHAEGKIHHSSLSGGRNVGAAGTFEIENGVIRSIDAESGHYKHFALFLAQALERLEAMGADLSKSRVQFRVENLKLDLERPFEKTMH